MPIIQTEFATGNCSLPLPESAGEVVNLFLKHTMPTTGDGTVVNDIIEFGPLPAGYRVVDMTAIAEDLDTGNTIVLDVGVMSGEWESEDQARTCGAEFFSGLTIGQAGGVARMSLASGFTVAKTSEHRSIGVKITTAAATPTASVLRLNVLIASE